MEQVYKEKKDCTGCSACYSICPKGVITMMQDEKGFKYPLIDKGKCVNCRMCAKVCPIKNSHKNQIENQKVYAAKNKNLDTRLKSSSGGVFGELAKYIIQEQNGCVFGVAFDEEKKAKHIKIEDIKQIKLLQTSKYVQSDVNNTYEEVKNELLKDRYVLYSGTPCQIAGLLSALNNINKEKLITCDIVCHGVPSPKVFNDYQKVLERKYKSRIKNINFRYKNEKEPQNFLVEFEDRKKYIKKLSSDIYYKLFIKNFTLRESCFNCKFSNMNRVADITLGDFWGIKKNINNFDDNKGVSLVILNTSQGEDIFQKIQDKFEIAESNSKDCLQPNLIRPTEMPKKYNNFWMDYIEKGYKHTSKKYILLLNIERVKRKMTKIVRRKNG